MRIVNKKMFFLLFLTVSWPLFVISVPYYNQFDRDEVIGFLKQFIQPKDLVFDVGANRGDKTEVYLACGARVVCVEPQPNCVRQLKNRFSKNNFVYIEALGLAEKKGNLELYLCDQADTLTTFHKESTQTGRFADRSFKWSKRVSVPVCKLDDVIEKHGLPRFCKIDVEGFELKVLQGLSQPIRCISFECNAEHMDTTFACVDYLKQLGYDKFNFAIGERGRFSFGQWMKPAQLKEALVDLAASSDWSEIWGLWGDVYAFIEVE